MPFGVSRWPQAPDPRPPWFGMFGGLPESCAPWKWFCYGTNATGLLEPFLDGCVITASAWAFGYTQWEVSDFPQTGWTTRMILNAYDRVIPGVHDFTQHYDFRVLDETLTTMWTAIDSFTFTDPILGLPYLGSNPGTPLFDDWTGSVFFEPRPWDS